MRCRGVACRRHQHGHHAWKSVTNSRPSHTRSGSLLAVTAAGGASARSGVAAWILAALLAVWAASSSRPCPSYARRH